MEDKHSPISPLFYPTFPNVLVTQMRPGASHIHNARVQAIQALQDEVEGLRKDINALKQLVADKEFDMLVYSLIIRLTHAYLLISMQTSFKRDHPFQTLGVLSLDDSVRLLACRYCTKDLHI
jgi:hypothetical protein